MKYLIVFIFTIICVNSVNAQINDSDSYSNFNFIIHLTKNGLIEEAEIEKENFFSYKNLNQLYKDSVNYVLGMSYQSEHNNELSRDRFLEVSNESFLFYPARYQAAILEAEKGNAKRAVEIINSIDSSNNDIINELKNFELAATHLLNHNVQTFDSILNKNSFTNTLLQEEAVKLKECAQVQKKIKRKSAFAAGMLSAVVPGLGKVYVGNNGQALASFLTVGVMGGITVENYFKLGIEHPQTIFFASVFSLFYIGNIWGSAVSVQLVKTEKELENKHNILVGIKLPISKFFH
ncbi:MAG: hypothetical protein IPM51_08150 [Sphingobacteriaceae bacterium]|nr:hypothetical protein [Sphingobacteriaceae bacterium]